PVRTPYKLLTPFHMDVAASIQAVLDEAVLRLTRSLAAKTGARNLCLAGGVALNCVANGKVLRDGKFDSIWIQPAAGDAGGAVGSALAAYHQFKGQPRSVGNTDGMSGAFLGPEFSQGEIEKRLAATGARFTVLDEAAMVETTARALADQLAVGWFQGRMEFGPRALGSRSILGDPRNPAMQSVLNLKIKQRESFRPFAPSVLKERAAEYFALPAEAESPYMLLVASLREQHRTAISGADRATMTTDPDLRRRVNIVRSTLPAITHVDYSARLQIVDEERHGRFYRLLKAFERTTGCPVLVNTSFNVRGEPIVCSPVEALRCFLATDMDALVLEDFVLRKEQMKGALSAAERAQHLAAFEAD
ncbi:MAG: carbamoyltransferase family protein, partial [Limisphaerales bacterium]